MARKEAKIHMTVYYISKMLQGVEIRYLDIEKLALALIVSARKLRSYFQSHGIIILTNLSLRQVLSKPKVSGRMVKWSSSWESLIFDFKADKL